MVEWIQEDTAVTMVIRLDISHASPVFRCVILHSDCSAGVRFIVH